MDAHAFRAQNFAALYGQFCDANQHLPQRGLLKIFAEKVGLTPAYVSHLKNQRKTIGAATARQIEVGCGKPHGWMDLPHTEQEPLSADERMLVDQILSLYRASPDTVKLLMAQAVRTVLQESSHADASDRDAAVGARDCPAAGASPH